MYKCDKTKEEIINIIAEEFEEAYENYNKAMNQKDITLLKKHQARYAAISSLFYKLEISELENTMDYNP